MWEWPLDLLFFFYRKNVFIYYKYLCEYICCDIIKVRNVFNLL